MNKIVTLFFCSLFSTSFYAQTGHLEGGMFHTARATTILKIPTSGRHQSAYIAGQYSHSDGPFESLQGFNRGNVFGKFHTHVTHRSELGIMVGAFTSAWAAS